jgi:hypothetical protein
MKTMMICKALLVVTTLSMLVGCEDDDTHKQVAIIATQAADRQAQQNTEMAQLNREVAEGTRRMVEADAEARKEIVSVHQELQAERATLTTGFDKLEVERKEIAQQRRTESMLVPAAKLIGSTCVVIAVLVFCISVIHGRRHDDAIEAELNNLLIQELTSDQPRLLSLRGTMPSIEDQSPPDEGETTRLTAES